jgi:uncharacterized protein
LEDLPIMGTVCIIGGGPAGLGVANALCRAGIDFQLFDAGPPLETRQHDRAEQLGAGIGGAGLFSDGKFSYFPSGTYLYQLGNQVRLKNAYVSIAQLLSAAGIAAPRFPSTTIGGPNSDDSFSHKHYASQYGSLTQRRELTQSLIGDSQSGQINPFCRVQRIAKSTPGHRVTYFDERACRTKTSDFSELVIATGRFGGLALSELFNSPISTEEQRYELGLRVEHPNGIGFLSKIKNNDVKLIMHNDDVQIRTFCTCRQGEAWHIPYEGASALSGRSDGPKTEYSNFGLLPRFAGAKRAQGRAIWNHFRERFGESRQALWQPMQEFMGGPPASVDGAMLSKRPWYPRNNFQRARINDLIHDHLRTALVEALAILLERYPDMNSPETLCLFPAIEGVGIFPTADDDLRLRTKDIWCCGDVVGRFRGLVPALVSGQYVGCAIAESRASIPTKQEAVYGFN